jgi:hypothetical protein
LKERDRISTAHWAPFWFDSFVSFLFSDDAFAMFQVPIESFLMSQKFVIKKEGSYAGILQMDIEDVVGKKS